MEYILIEKSLFEKLMGQLLLDESVVENHFSEEDYWATGKEACEYLNISMAMLNAYRRDNLIFHCKLGEIYRYKKADIYKLKAQMDSELVESGRILANCKLIGSKEDAISALEEILQGG